MTITVTASYGGFRRLVPQPASPHAPPVNRPDEYWWIQWNEDMPLEPACISFKGDTPAKIQQLGDDSWGPPLEEVPHIKLVERVAPIGSAKAVEERDIARASARKMHRRCQSNEQYIASLRDEIQRLESLIDGLTKWRTA